PDTSAHRLVRHPQMEAQFEDDRPGKRTHSPRHPRHTGKHARRELLPADVLALQGKYQKDIDSIRTCRSPWGGTQYDAAQVGSIVYRDQRYQPCYRRPGRDLYELD